jgi:DNA polymerase-4
MLIHIDLDCYFASAERTIDPSLKGKPLAIGNRGDVAIFSHTKKQTFCFKDNPGAFSGASYYDKFGAGDNWQQHFVEKGRIRGMIVTASYEARALGVKSVMSLGEALRICPALIIRPSRMRLYYDLSNRLFRFLQSRIPVLEQASIDEFYGDVTGWIKDEAIGEFIGQLKSEVMARFDLPVSIGASHTRTFAKVATSSAKPFGTRVLYPHQVAPFLDGMKIREFPGIGRRMADKLHRYGIKTIGQLKEMPDLLPGLGRPGKDIHRLIYGEEDGRITPFRERKSIGIGRTFDAVSCRSEFARRAMILARHLSYTIARLGVRPITYHFSIRYESGARSAASFSYKRLFNEKFFKDMALLRLRELDIYATDAITYIGMSASNFATHKTVFSLLEFDNDRRFERLLGASTKIRDKYGIDALAWAGERECF